MEKKEMKKKVTDLVVGDKVLTKDGSFLTIKSIGNGIFYASKLITFTNGEKSCELNADILTIITQP